METSRSMLPRGDGALNAIQDLLKSGMQGQLATGDTLGLWTFNKELVRGEFPLQTWSTQNQPGIMGRVLKFLRNQRCEEKGRLDKVMPVLQEVVKRSRYITVVVISSGEQSMRGTPFDEPINNAYKTWRKQQEKAHMPFVTVLQGQNGAITDYRVGQAPWSADLPPLPKDLLVARAKQKAAVAAMAKAPPPTLPPLIVSGRKPQSIPPPPATPLPMPTNLPVATSAALTNPTPESATAVTPPPTAPAPPAAAVTRPTSASLTTLGQEPVSSPAVAPPAANSGNDTRTKLEPQSLAATPAEPHPAEPRPSSHLPSEPETTVTAKTLPLPAKDSEPAPAVAAAKPTASTSPRPAEATNVPEQGSSNLLIWAVVASVAGLFAGLGWFWIGRGRSNESGSLITHSFEQHK